MCGWHSRRLAFTDENYDWMRFTLLIAAGVGCRVINSGDSSCYELIALYHGFRSHEFAHAA